MSLVYDMWGRGTRRSGRGRGDSFDTWGVEWGNVGLSWRGM